MLKNKGRAIGQLVCSLGEILGWQKEAWGDTSDQSAKCMGTSTEGAWEAFAPQITRRPLAPSLTANAFVGQGDC